MTGPAADRDRSVAAHAYCGICDTGVVVTAKTFVKVNGDSRPNSVGYGYEDGRRVMGRGAKSVEFYEAECLVHYCKDEI